MLEPPQVAPRRPSTAHRPDRPGPEPEGRAPKSTAASGSARVAPAIDPLGGLLARAVQERAAGVTLTKTLAPPASARTTTVLQRVTIAPTDQSPRTIYGSVKLRRRAFEHIRDRHAPGYAEEGDTEFTADFWDDLYAKMATTVRDGWSGPNINNRPGTRYEYEFEDQVGWDGNDECYVLRVIVHNNWVTTAHPQWYR